MRARSHERDMIAPPTSWLCVFLERSTGLAVRLLLRIRDSPQQVRNALIETQVPDAGKRCSIAEPSASFRVPFTVKLDFNDFTWAETTRSTSDRDLQEFLIGAIPKLRAFARMMTDDVAFADDLVHQTLLQGWAHRDDAEGDSNSTTWLFQILRTLYYSDPRRANALAAALGMEPEEFPDTLSSDGDSSTLRLHHLRLALGRLSEQHREVLILVGASGFDYEEVSRILGCPLGTVKSRLARARKGLERVLLDWEAAQDEPEPKPSLMPSEEIH